jgi:hypothetical protein
MTKKTQQLVEQARAQGISPLEYMLAVLRDETVEPGRRDEMAKAAAPYIHPRLATIDATVSLSVLDKLNDTEQRALAAALAAVTADPEAAADGASRAYH